MSPRSRAVPGGANESRVFNRRLKWAIALIIAVTISAIFSLRIADLLRRREMLREAAERRAANLSLILSAYLQNAFAATDQSLRQIALYSPRIGGPQAPAKDWEPILRLAEAGLDGFGSLSVTDAGNVIRHSTDSVAGGAQGDPYIFKRLSSDSRDVLVVDAPFRSPIDGRMLMPLGRRLPGKDGEFDGMIVATFIPAKLGDFLKTVDVGHDGEIWIFHPDGYLMFGKPAQANQDGKVAAYNRIFEMAVSTGSGSIRGKAIPDGPLLITAFQTLDNPRMVVAVSFSDAEILAEWRSDGRISSIVGSLVIVVMAIILFLLFREIDARSVVEQSLSRVLRMESIGRFTGGVAHDFNNMLTIILGNVSLMRERGAEGHPLDQIDEAARRASDLTHRLLTVASRQPLQPEILDLNEVVASLRPTLKSLTGEAVRLETNSSPALCIANIDRVQTETAVMNICINARDAMPKGGVLKIETGTVALNERDIQDDTDFKPGRYVLVAASDTGKGISPENIPRIFEPFFTTKEAGKGIGLGLSTVYGFVKQSGGCVKVQSEIDRGTTVTIYFPEASGTPATPSGKPVASAMRGNGETILVVEDEDGIRELVEVTLSGLGYNVIAAPDGPTALDIAREHARIDLLLTDIMLPKGMNGYQVVEELEKARPGLRALFASGYSEEFSKTQRRHKLLMKPYGSAELSEAVYKALH